MLKRLPAAPLSQLLPALLLVVLAAYLGWMLSLPAWPSQDGPVHLYYTRVLGTLLSSAPSAYRPYFFIKHLFPPYAVYYYALLALSHAMSLLAADRVVVCAYFILFLFGFRYAARAIGPGADRTTLLASLLLLSWPLGMGFTNYCVSLSLAMWAIGLWLRLGRSRSLGRRIGFVALLLLITLSHPVPLLLVLAFGGVDLLCRFLAARRASEPLPLPELLPNVLTLAVGSLCLLYVKAFTAAHPLEQRTVVQMTVAQQVVRRLKDLAIVKNVELLYGHWWEVLVYRGCLLVLLLVGIGLTAAAWRASRKAGRWTPGDSLTVFAALMFLAVPLLPSDLSGAYYFTERLNILLWILPLLAASAWVPAPDRAPASGVIDPHPINANPLRADYLAAAFTVFGTVLLLHTANRVLRPFAEQDFQLAHTDLPLRGQLVMVLTSKPQVFRWAGPPWEPFYWDGVALLRRNDGILVNAPWLDSPIIPLGTTAAMPGGTLPPVLANSPYFFTGALGGFSTLRSTVVDKSMAALISPPREGVGVRPANLLGDGWTCQSVTKGGFRLCTREAAANEAHLHQDLDGSLRETTKQ